VRLTDLDKLNLVKLGYGGSVLGSSQFLRLPQLPQKITLVSKVVKSDTNKYGYLALLVWKFFFPRIMINYLKLQGSDFQGFDTISIKIGTGFELTTFPFATTFAIY